MTNSVADELLERVTTNCRLVRDEEAIARDAISYYLNESETEPTWADMKPDRRAKVEAAILGAISGRYHLGEFGSGARAPFDTARVLAAQMRQSMVQSTPQSGRSNAKSGRSGGRGRR